MEKSAETGDAETVWQESLAATRAQQLMNRDAVPYQSGVPVVAEPPSSLPWMMQFATVKVLPSA